MADRFHSYPIIHVYGQEAPHSEAIIACNTPALDALKKLVNDGEGSIEVMAEDGEGYSLVLMVTDETDKLPHHYNHVLDDCKEVIYYFGGSWDWFIDRCQKILGLK